MPTRNIVKVYVQDCYYHVYNRGWNKTDIFISDEDYEYFEWLLCRHLSPSSEKDKRGREYPLFYPSVELSAYCLMSNHFHLLVYQRDDRAVVGLMKSVLIAYSSYFNKKYKRRGPLFESTYKAVLVRDDSQLMHLTRYIHLNHDDYGIWPHSSYQDYLGLTWRAYIHPRPILDLFDSIDAYVEFTSDYETILRERGAMKRRFFSE